MMKDHWFESPDPPAGTVRDSFRHGKGGPAWRCQRSTAPSHQPDLNNASGRRKWHDGRSRRAPLPLQVVGYRPAANHGLSDRRRYLQPADALVACVTLLHRNPGSDGDGGPLTRADIQQPGALPEPDAGPVASLRR